jgi:hypothetical protein
MRSLLANRLHIAGEPEAKVENPCLDAALSPSVLQAIKPFLALGFLGPLDQNGFPVLELGRAHPLPGMGSFILVFYH